MKKYLIVALLALIPLSAFAAENLRQKSHGGAVWEQNSDRTTFPTGGVLVLDFTNLGAAITRYIRAPKTGNIMAVYSVLQNATGITGSTLTVRTNNSDTIDTGDETFTNTGHTVTIAASGSAGDLDSSELTSPTTATKVDQGDIIAVTNSAGSGTAAATITIVIE